MLPGLTGRDDPVSEMHSAASDVVGELVRAEPDEIVLLASGTRTCGLPVRERLGLHRWGVGAGTHRRDGVQSAADEVPLPFAVGSTLLDAAGWSGSRRWHQVGWDDAGGAALAVGSSLAATSGRIGLLVLGDGSARRTVKAPGHLDERADGFDAALLEALRGDPRRLADVDPATASELMVTGLPAWQALAGALVGAPSATWGAREPRSVQVRWTGDPFGVLYLVGWVHAA
jgi:hypothetical protein